MTSTQTPVRTESFPCDGPADIQVHITAGEVLVELVDNLDLVSVAVYPGTGEAQAGFLGRLGLGSGESVAEALKCVKTHFTRGHLVVQAPARRLAPVPLRILVRARPGSKLQLTGGSNARFGVTGRPSGLTVQADSGELTADAVDRGCKVRLGKSKVRLGAVSGGLDVRTAVCDLSVQELRGGAAKVTTSGGIAAFGTVEDDLQLTTAAGTASVDDAVSGRLWLNTGGGSIRVGVRRGVTPQLELKTRKGTVTNRLPDSEVGHAGGRLPLSVTARSTGGDILVLPAG